MKEFLENQRAVKVLQSYFLYVPTMALVEVEKVGSEKFSQVVNWFILCVEDDRKPSEFTMDPVALKVLRKLLRIYEFDVRLEKELKKDVEQYLNNKVA